MGIESSAEFSKEKFIQIKFTYDPNFTPSWYVKGEIDRESVKQTYPLSLYAKQRSEEWNNQISPLISRASDKILIRYAFPSATCFILKYRIKTRENLFFEANSNPLAIWAIPPDDKWGYLPFHARLTHELVHELGLKPYSYWDILEDEVRSKNRDNPVFNKQENYAYREELVVRHITYKITEEVWGQEFADWFLERESKVIPARESPFEF